MRLALGVKVYSPCPASFCAVVPPATEPVLNEEHDAHRWISADETDANDRNLVEDRRHHLPRNSLSSLP